MMIWRAFSRQHPHNGEKVRNHGEFLFASLCEHIQHVAKTSITVDEMFYLADLVFIQNGMLEPWLAERGLAENTQASIALIKTLNFSMRAVVVLVHQQILKCLNGARGR